MRKGHLNALGVAALLAVPAVAIGGGSTTYSGEGTSDPGAKIELRISDGADRKIEKVTVKNLPYGGDLCSSTGRTPRAKAEGPVKVKDDGTFRFVGAGETQDPLQSGEITVVGEASRRKVTGKMKFTFGKDGCKSDAVEFKAPRIGASMP